MRNIFSLWYYSLNCMMFSFDKIKSYDWSTYKSRYNFEGSLYLKKVYGLKNTLNFEWSEKGDEEKKDSSTQVEKGEKKIFFFKSFRSLFRCVEWTMWALYFHRVWKQVIYILDLVQNYLKLSTKIYHTKYKNIILCIIIYFSVHVLKLLTKIF